MRATAVIACAALLAARDSVACVCPLGPDLVFFHTSGQSGKVQHLVLPSNAKGALLQFQGTPTELLEATFSDKITVIDRASGKLLPKVVTTLAPLVKVVPFEGKVPLQEAPSAIREALGGVLRVGPQAGFVQGKRYLIRYTPERGKRQQIELSVGPPLDVSVPPNFSIQLDGSPYRASNEPPGNRSCSGGFPSALQKIRYSLAPSYRAYGQAVTFYTYQIYSPGDRPSRFVKTGHFVRTAWPEFSCSDPWLNGGGDYGSLTDVVWGECELAHREPRMVKGYAGMLELADKLYETSTLAVSFEQATGPACKHVPHNPPTP